jgi:CDP-diacylglycerol--serine O-phosphatidyltransferase
MVSKVPTFSAKQFRVRPRYVGLVLVGVGGFVAFLVSTPWVTLSLAGLAYAISIPLSAWQYHRLQARHETVPAADPLAGGDPPAESDDRDS